MNSGARGRYAPSPTGRVHLGNARTALVAWLSARAGGGAFVWRVEDLDASRNVRGLEAEAMHDLAWMGIDWDEGPDLGGPHSPYRQSERTHLYEAALVRLFDVGRVFPCRASRKDLQSIASAPHAPEGPPYPRSLRPSSLANDWFAQRRQRHDAAVRFLVDDLPVCFHDRVAGRHDVDVSATVGDFVLVRRDGVFAYQLAVVVDDMAMRISEVVRGKDLLDSTGRQIQLIEALGGTPPRYAHVPLVVNAAGEKLSKRDAAMTVSFVRAEGVRPQQLVGYLAWTLGLLDRPEAAAPEELVSSFDWTRLRKEDWRLRADVVARIGVIR